MGGDIMVICDVPVKTAYKKCKHFVSLTFGVLFYTDKMFKNRIKFIVSQFRFSFPPKYM